METGRSSPHIYDSDFSEETSGDEAESFLVFPVMIKDPYSPNDLKTDNFSSSDEESEVDQISKRVARTCHVNPAYPRNPQQALEDQLARVPRQHCCRAPVGVPIGDPNSTGKDPALVYYEIWESDIQRRDETSGEQYLSVKFQNFAVRSSGSPVTTENTRIMTRSEAQRLFYLHPMLHQYDMLQHNWEDRNRPRPWQRRMVQDLLTLPNEVRVVGAHSSRLGMNAMEVLRLQDVLAQGNNEQQLDEPRPIRGRQTARRSRRWNRRMMSQPSTSRS